MTSEAQRRAIRKYHKTRKGKEALARADRKRQDDPERKAYLARKAREYRARMKALKDKKVDGGVLPDQTTPSKAD